MKRSKEGARSWTRREFLAAAGLALSGGGCVLVRESPSPPAAGVPAIRRARLASGANVCRWFRFPQSKSTEHFDRYIGDREVEAMASMGLKHVRLCVAPKVILDEAGGAIRAETGALLFSAVQRLQRAGLLVMVDLHNEDRDAELDPAWQAAFVRFWGELAGRLAAFDPDLTLLEILNEPVFAKREGEWDELNLRVAEAIRARAPGHTLVTSGVNWGGIDGLPKLKLLPDRNVVYSFHCYDPFPFTHQGATWAGDNLKPLRGVPYPSSPEAVAPLLAALADHPESAHLLEKYGAARWNRETIAARFRKAAEWGRQNGVPLYCGEFGALPLFARPEHRANWFRDFGAVLAEQKIGWAVWGWDEGFGLNRRKSGDRLSVDRVVAEALGLKPVPV